MNKVDTSTLRWVKSEIDNTLTQAERALDSFAENVGDTTQLRFCISHLHQVVGTLQMVELDGAALLGSEAEALADAMLEDPRRANQANLDLLKQGLDGLSAYLERLLSGYPDTPLKLIGRLNELRTARDADPIPELSLFRPDLTVHPPSRGSARIDPRDAQIGKLRAAYLVALLAYLRDNTNQDALQRLGEVLDELQQVSRFGSVAQLWWVAAGFVEALSDGSLSPSAERNQMLVRADWQIKKWLDDGEEALLREPADELVSAMLYEMGKAHGFGRRVTELRQAFDIDAFLGDGDDDVFSVAGPPEPVVEAVRQRLRATLEEARQCLDAFFEQAGEGDSLQPLAERFREAAGELADMEAVAFRTVVEQLAVSLAELADGRIEDRDEASMRMASALLFLESAIDRIGEAEERDLDQARVAAGALRGLSGAETDDGVGIHVTDTVLSDSEFRQILDAVAGEIQSNLRRVEAGLTEFADNRLKPRHLEGIPAALSQIEGALQILSQQRAAELVELTRRQVSALGEGRLRATDTVVDALAVACGSIEAYVDGLNAGRSHLGEIVSRAMDDLQIAIYDPAAAQQSLAGLADQVYADFEKFSDEPHRRENLLNLRQHLRDVKSRAAHAGEERIQRLAGELMKLLDVVLEDPGFRVDTISATLGRGFTSLRTLCEPFADDADDESDWLPPDVGQGEELEIEIGAPEAVTPQDRSEPDLEISLDALAEEALTSAMDDPGGEADREDLSPEEPADDYRDPIGSGEKPGPELEIFTPEQEAGGLGEQALPHDSAEADLEISLNSTGPGAPAEPPLLTESVEPPPESEDEDLWDPADLARGREELPDGEAQKNQFFATGLDPEIGEIFLEELGELLAIIEQEVSAWRDDPARDLASLRRCFHTLKGSGRLAGAADIGELGWIVEEVLNHAIAGAASATVPMRDFVEHAATTIRELMESERAFATEVVNLEEFRQQAAALMETDAPAAQTAEPRDALLEVFRGEVASHVGALRKQMERLPSSWNAGSELIRGLHTLAGNAGALQLGAMSNACLVLERWYEDRAKAGQFLGAEERHWLSQVLDTVDELMAGRVVRGELAPQLAERFASVHRAVAARRETMESKTAPPASVSWAEEEATPDTGDGPESAGEATADAKDESESAGEATADAKDESESAEEASPDTGDGPESAGEAEPTDVEQTRPAAPVVPAYFVEEVRDILSDFGRHLESWRARPADTTNRDGVMRALHTLKGSARMLEMDTLGDLSHAAETLLESVPGGGSAELSSLLDEVHDELLAELQALQQGRFSDGVGPLLERLGALVDDPSPLMPAPEIETEQDLETAKPAKPATAPVQEAATAETPHRDALRVSAETLDDLSNFAGEVSIARSAIQQQVGGFRQNLGELRSSVARFRNQLRELEMQAEIQIVARPEGPSSPAREDFDPLELDRFSRLQQLSRSISESVNDLETIQSGMDQIVGTVEGKLAEQARLGRELQEGLMRTRMVSFATSIPRLRMLVRQAARTLGRQAELVTSGTDVEMDRNVLDRMMGPLEHMIRNAVDHGIEDAETRHRLGKPVSGVVRIECEQQGNEIIVHLSDDGRGLAIDRIRERAEEQEMVRPGDELSDEQLGQLIMLPGFSTAAEVTQLSGRGVGLDVVANEVRQLGGHISLNTTIGKG
ncbi:MAG: Hpt domain-containing protein, partial [Gammaproteobacteria bacterium]|nr:Hpt domain-containing protein [Gammaproteobacteria bacterium]